MLTGNSVPDGEGGLIVTQHHTCLPNQTDPMAVVDLDASTGQPKWTLAAAGVADPNAPGGISYCYPDTNKSFEPQFAVRGDGAVVIAAMTNNGLPPLTIVKSGQGTQITIPSSTDTRPDGSTFAEFSPMGPPMVNSDDSTYLEYEVRTIAANPRRVTSAVLYLLKIGPDNSTATFTLSSTAEDKNLLPGRVIPDGQGGVLATWTVAPSTTVEWNAASSTHPHPYQAAHVAAGSPGPTYDLSFTPRNLADGQYPTLVLGENSTVFALGRTAYAAPATPDGSLSPTMPQDGDQIVSFDLNSGNVNWISNLNTGHFNYDPQGCHPDVPNGCFVNSQNPSDPPVYTPTGAYYWITDPSAQNNLLRRRKVADSPPSR